MRTVSTTNARKHIKTLLDRVRETGEIIAIGRRARIEALLIKFPSHYNKELSDITNVNTYSSSFDFLYEEPELYSADDLKKRYV